VASRQNVDKLGIEPLLLGVPFICEVKSLPKPQISPQSSADYGGDLVYFMLKQGNHMNNLDGKRSLAPVYELA
jgi:hypothetical protein